jgi:hypothetical protein
MGILAGIILKSLLKTAWILVMWHTPDPPELGFSKSLRALDLPLKALAHQLSWGFFVSFLRTLISIVSS